MRVLEHQQLHHHHLVDVGPSPLGGPVVVEGLNDGGEGFPVYEGFYFGESVAQFFYVFVEVSEEVGCEWVHGWVIAFPRYKSSRGWLKRQNQRLIEILYSWNYNISKYISRNYNKTELKEESIWADSN